MKKLCYGLPAAFKDRVENIHIFSSLEKLNLNLIMKISVLSWCAIIGF